MITCPGAVAANEHALSLRPEIEVGHIGEMFSELPTSPTTLSVSTTPTTAEQAEPTRTISSTEDWNRIWNSVLAQEEIVVVDNSLTVEAISKGSSPATATQFTLRGEGQTEDRVTISTNTPSGYDKYYYHSLVNLGVREGTSISIENINFESKVNNEAGKSGLAININNRTGNVYWLPEIDTLNFSDLSFSGFNDDHVIAIDNDGQRNYSVFGSISNFIIRNVSFYQNISEGSLLETDDIKNAIIEDLHVEDNISNSSSISLDGGIANSSLSLKNSEFIGNTTKGSTLSLQQFQTLSLTGSSFINNHNTWTNTSNKKGFGGALSLSSDGGAGVGEDPKKGMPLIKDVKFIDNSSERYGGAVFSASNVLFENTEFTNNTAYYGGAVYIGEQVTPKIHAIFSNVKMQNNTAKLGRGSAIYAQIQTEWNQSRQINIDIESINNQITWQGSNDSYQKTISLQFIGSDPENNINLGLYSQQLAEQSTESEAEAYLQISGGLSVATSRSSNTENISNISIGGSTDGNIFDTSNVKLGGKSTFEKTTVNFDVKAGRFELLSDADLNWEDGAGGRLTTAAGSEFALALQEIDPTNADSHGERAKIHLAGNELDLKQGSSLSVNWNERLDMLPAVGSHWLILAEDARLTEGSAPDIAIKTDNWILDHAMQVAEGTQLTQGIANEDETFVEGTEENVYIGFSTESTAGPDPIDPDEDIRSATNLTAHFAYSSIREVSRGMLHWRPVRSDAFWAIPQYLHDRRDRDDFGVGFDAQLRGITVGKDFTTDNGFWGAAFGYGDGNIHSLGGIAYTSGDVQSWWAGIYGQHNVNNWRFEGILSYLCQDADQDQSNSAADLHLNTKNDVVLVSGKVARSFVLDQNSERTIRMTPSLGLEYVWLKQRDFNVRMNSGETLLKGEAEDMNVFSVPVDLRFDRDWACDNGWRHNAGVTLGGSFNFGDDTMSGDFTGPNGVAADGWRLIPLDDYQGRVAAEYVLLHPNQAFSISAGAGYTISKSRELLDLQAVIRYTW